MEKTSYRLAEYEIFVMSDGEIWWKAHTGFGSAESGKCFIEGRILFIGPPIEVDESSFLKNEFLERLRPLPQWDKTEFYCPRYQIHACGNAHAPKKRRSHHPAGSVVPRSSRASAAPAESDRKQSSISEPPPDDFDLFLQENTWSPAEIGTAVINRFKAATSYLKKVKVWKHLPFTTNDRQ